jgi:CheY-like chemotaxis protein
MQPIRLLLIDDDVDDALIFGEALAQIGLPVEYRYEPDAISGLATLQREQLDMPHFIFLDLNMPKIDGFICLRAIKKLVSCARVPVVIYTTSSSDQDRQETKHLGSSHFLTKTHSIKQLAEKIFEIVSSRFKFSTDPV